MKTKLLIVMVSTLTLSCGQAIPPAYRNAQFPDTIAVAAPVSGFPSKQRSAASNEVERQTEGGDSSSFKPKQSYVPDAKTAIKIAEAVWLPIYGEKILKGERPFKANLENGVWVVSGTLPQGMLGGTAEARISKETGCILRVIHYK